MSESIHDEPKQLEPNLVRVPQESAVGAHVLPEIDSAAPSSMPTNSPWWFILFSTHVRVRTLKSFKYRDFQLFWATSASSMGAEWIHNVVLGWLTFSLTNSPLLTALTIGISVLPSVLVSPVAGLLIDNSDRRRLFAVMLGIRAFLTTLFVMMILFGSVATWHIFSFVFLYGVTGSFLVPVQHAILPNIVPRRHLVNAFALVSLSYSFTRLIVPAVTGVLIVWIGSAETLMLSVAFLLIGAVTAFRINLRHDESRKFEAGSGIADLVEGVRFIIKEKIILAITILSGLMLMFFTSVNMGLMPVFAADVYNGGPEVLGLLVTALGGGMTLGSLLLASLGEPKRKGRNILIAVTATFIGLAAFSQSTVLVVSLVILVAYGATTVWSWTLIEVTLQSVVPDELRGRVTSISMMSHIMFPIGTLVIGTVAEFFGAPIAALTSAIAMALAVGVLSLTLRRTWLSA